jgi:predicted transcriptional regulator
MSSVLAMATELILALIRAGQLSPSAVVPLLQETHAHLLALKARDGGSQARIPLRGAAVPAVLSWQASITPYSVTCLECGASLQWLSGRHLQKHGLDARAYRRKYGIPHAQLLAAQAVTARRKRLIQQQRPWEQAPTYRQAQARKAAAEAQSATPRRTRRRPPTAR